MPRKKVVKDEGAGSPAQQDEADITEEANAELGEDGGFFTDEARIRELGAVDAESVQENRRLEDIVDKKRGNVKNVPFNAGDLLTKYETLIKFWPANTLDINVKRLTGTPIQQVITNRPRSGAELYEALKTIHGQNNEAEYELKFFDTNGKQFRGNGRITMPDARATAPQQGQQLMNNYPPPPPPYGAPQGYPPPQPYVQPGYPPAQPQSMPSAPPAPVPAAPVPAPGSDLVLSMGYMNQMFELFQRMQQQAAPVVAHQAPPPQPVVFPPMPVQPAPANMGEMLMTFEQMLDMWKRMQPPAQESVAPQQATIPPPQIQIPAQTVPSVSPMMSAVPPMQPPPGMFWVPGLGYVPIERLMAAIAPQPAQQPQPPVRRTMYRGEDPREDHESREFRRDPREFQREERYEPQYRGQRHYAAPLEPREEQRPRTPAEEIRHALATVKGTMDAVRDMRNAFPQESNGEGSHLEPTPPSEDDDSPIRVIETGPAKIVINKKDGTMRPWETGFANLDKIMKWAGEQIETVQNAQTQRQKHQAQAPQPRSLPQGYVEVTEGYRAPDGYVAVRVPMDQPQQQYSPPPTPPPPAQDLPPPPSYMPPPLDPQNHSAWMAPSFPPENEEQT